MTHFPEEDEFFDDGKRRKTVKRKREPKERRQFTPREPLSLPLKPVVPKTPNQERAFNSYKKNYNLLLYGTAGTGKSFISLAMALKSVLAPDSEYRKVIILRSMTPSKDAGFLPGSLAEKSKIYELPYVSICAELFGRDDAYEILKKRGLIEFSTTSYLRGLTFLNAIVILDEFQNGTLQEIHTVITRIGEGCRAIICGDTKQNDLVKKYEISGGPEAIKIINRMPSFKSVEFDVDDIVRSGIVREWILSREELEI